MAQALESSVSKRIREGKLRAGEERGACWLDDWMFSCCTYLLQCRWRLQVSGRAEGLGLSLNPKPKGLKFRGES